MAAKVVSTDGIVVPKDMPAPKEQLPPTGSDSEDLGPRFDVLCMLTKGTAKKIIFSLELFEYIKSLNVDLDDLHFLHFPGVYELQARSQLVPNGFDVYKFTEDGKVMRQQRPDEAEAEQVEEESQELQEPSTEDKYDKPQPVAAFGKHLLRVTRLSDDKTAEELEKERKQIESAVRVFVGALEESLQRKQTLSSSARNLVHAMTAYDTYVVDMEIDVDQAMLDMAIAIVSQSKQDKAKLKPDEAKSTAAYTEEAVQDIDPVEKLQDLVLRAFNTYNEKRLARNAEIDPEVLAAAEEIILTKDAEIADTDQEPGASGDTTKEIDTPDPAQDKTEQSNEEKTQGA
jgi:hypothetical protein